jgi:hypothetical protein
LMGLFDVYAYRSHASGLPTPGTMVSAWANLPSGLRYHLDW